MSLHLAYILYELCETKKKVKEEENNEICEIKLDDIYNVLYRLAREQKYIVYSNRRDMIPDLKYILIVIKEYNKECVKFNEDDIKDIKICREGLEFLKNSLNKYSNLISPELKTRLPLVLYL